MYRRSHALFTCSVEHVNLPLVYHFYQGCSRNKVDFQWWLFWSSNCCCWSFVHALYHDMNTYMFCWLVCLVCLFVLLQNMQEHTICFDTNRKNRQMTWRENHKQIKTHTKNNFFIQYLHISYSIKTVCVACAYALFSSVDLHYAYK